MSSAVLQAQALALRVSEIFYSIQGESVRVGLPTVFVRLSGCPLRCVYCDTAYAFHGGRRMTQEEILKTVTSYHARDVTVTGGEPLAQRGCIKLLRALCDGGYRVSLETSGALDLSLVDARVMKVVDLKTPASKESQRNCYSNVALLGRDDQLKFVICDRPDYEWARAQLYQRRLHERCEVLFSPCHGKMDAARLADWILADALPVRLQVQLHKYLWGDVRGR